MDPILKLQNGSDVRGVAVEGVADEPVTLTPEYANRIVQAFVLWLSKKSGKKASELKIAVGHDSRISAPMLKQQALMAIVAQGATAVDCSMATTPAMFMSLVYEETKYLLTDHDEYQRMANTCNPYGDGKASKRIIEAILYHYGLSQEKPDSFIASK